MKKINSSFLAIALFLTGCSGTNLNENNIKDTEVEEMQFMGIDDPALTSYIEDELYENIVEELDSDKYFIENVQATYVSKEYLEESQYNSQSNIYFGYSLEQLNQAFGDTKYVFDIDENGNTTVKELVEITDNFNQVIQNVMIGSGVILICVTVSLVVAPSAPAVSLIFATSAKTATTFAVSGAALDGVVSAAITGYETGDIDKAIQSGLVSASEGFKWGAIFGAVSGGASNTISLKGATRNGLTMNQAAMIQKESKLPLELIKSFHSVEEYNVYKNSLLQLMKVNGKNALVQSIDWDFVGDLEDGRTNAQRVLDGLAPLDKSGKSYEIHHVGQKLDSPFAILTNNQHKSNYKIIHQNTGQSASDIDRNIFLKEKREFWMKFLEQTKGGID